MTRPDLSLIICTLNEADAIGAVLLEVDEALAGMTAEVIIVDDSDDLRTVNAVRALRTKNIQVRTLHREGERGLASAAVAGWAMSRGRVLGLMDGDGQHDPAVLPALVAAVSNEQADIAVASRYMNGAQTGLSGFRHALSQAGTWFAKLVTGVNTTDPMSGCFVFRRTWWRAARKRVSPVGYKILLELALSGPRKPKVAEAPATLRVRLGGESKLDSRVIADLFGQLVAKSSGGLLSARFVLFASVGATGVVVNLAVLSAAVAIGMTHAWGQAFAVFAAMTTNFLLNNLLTFRDRRLVGARFWRGMISFYAACTGGAFITAIVGVAAHNLGVTTVLAGLSGAILGAVWNYVAASKITWDARANRTDAARAENPALSQAA